MITTFSKFLPSCDVRIFAQAHFYIWFSDNDTWCNKIILVEANNISRFHSTKVFFYFYFSNANHFGRVRLMLFERLGGYFEEQLRIQLKTNWWPYGFCNRTCDYIYTKRPSSEQPYSLRTCKNRNWQAEQRLKNRTALGVSKHAVILYLQKVYNSAYFQSEHPLCYNVYAGVAKD